MCQCIASASDCLLLGLRVDALSNGLQCKMSTGFVLSYTRRCWNTFCLVQTLGRSLIWWGGLEGQTFLIAAELRTTAFVQSSGTWVGGWAVPGRSQEKSHVPEGESRCHRFISVFDGPLLTCQIKVCKFNGPLSVYGNCIFQHSHRNSGIWACFQMTKPPKWTVPFWFLRNSPAEGYNKKKSTLLGLVAAFNITILNSLK